MITDDSARTPAANITGPDLPACGGSVVHLIDAVLNPCCNPGDASDACVAAPLDAKQVNNEASAAPMARGWASSALASAVVAAGVAVVAL